MGVMWSRDVVIHLDTELRALAVVSEYFPCRYRRVGAAGLWKEKKGLDSVLSHHGACLGQASARMPAMKVAEVQARV